MFVNLVLQDLKEKNQIAIKSEGEFLFKVEKLSMPVAEVEAIAETAGLEVLASADFAPVQMLAVR